MIAPRLAFVWAQFAPYHLDRLDALARAGFSLTGVALAGSSRRYPWPGVPPVRSWELRTLLPGASLEQVPERTRTRALLAALRAIQPELVFLCNWPRPHVLAAALWARRARVPAVVMCDSWREDTATDGAVRRLTKRGLLMPYRGALVAGDRAGAYLAGLGVPATRIATGYDRLSVARVRAQAAGRSPVDGRPPGFVVVARLVPEKNVACALDAYAGYRRLCKTHGQVPAGLTILGDGPMRADLAARAQAQPAVRFAGFVGPETVAGTLAQAHALLLPSWREPWGLAVNEAVALGVPVLASSAVGAAETLVREGVSGHLLAPGDPQAWAREMHRMTAEPEARARLAAGSARLAPWADVGGFVDGVGWLSERLA